MLTTSYATFGFVVLDHVSHYVVLYTTLPYLFIHSSQLEFRNLDFFILCGRD